MPERITDSELAKLKELLAKIPPQDWDTDAASFKMPEGDVRIVSGQWEIAWVKADIGDDDDETITRAVAELAVKARNHLPALIAEIEAKRDSVPVEMRGNNTYCSACPGDVEPLPDWEWWDFCPRCGKPLEWK